MRVSLGYWKAPQGQWAERPSARVRIGGLWFTSWHPLRKALQQGLAHSQGYYYFLLVILSFLLLVTFACDTTYLIIISFPTFTRFEALSVGMILLSGYLILHVE